MASGGRDFESWLGNEGGDLRGGISVLIKEAWENSPTPSVMWGHRKDHYLRRLLSHKT